MRFKGVPHRWKSRCLRTNKLFKQHGEVQSIPLVFRPDGSVKPDSPPILEEVEERLKRLIPHRACTRRIRRSGSGPSHF